MKHLLLVNACHPLNTAFLIPYLSSGTRDLCSLFQSLSFMFKGNNISEVHFILCVEREKLHGFLSTCQHLTLDQLWVEGKKPNTLLIYPDRISFFSGLHGGMD